MQAYQSCLSINITLGKLRSGKIYVHYQILYCNTTSLGPSKIVHLYPTFIGISVGISRSNILVINEPWA